MIGKVNLYEELQKVQQITRQQEVLEEALAIINSHALAQESVSQRVYGNGPLMEEPTFSPNLDPDFIFSESAIEDICTRFRLRFLETKYFKGDIPFEAVLDLMNIEKLTGVKFRNFHIVAPAERFLLEDSQKDPMLFASLGNGRYYFIHQWGTDMVWYRSLLKYPFRHFKSLCITSLVISFIVTLLLPAEFSSGKTEFFFRFFMFAVLSCLFVTLAVIGGILRSDDFSENIWNSRYFN